MLVGSLFLLGACEFVQRGCCGGGCFRCQFIKGEAKSVIIDGVVVTALEPTEPLDPLVPPDNSVQLPNLGLGLLGIVFLVFFCCFLSFS